MIDNLKILIIDNDLITRLYNNDVLDDYSMYEKLYGNPKFSEIIQAKHTKVYKGVYFCFYPNKLEILFKPHYYFNNNMHNANDFGVKDCIRTLKDFANLFNLPTEELRIINIEYGINAISPIDCKNLITYATFHEKNQFITSNESLKYSRFSSKFDKNGRANQHKKIKIYAKGIQHPEYTDINTFRFEVKSKRSKYINSLNIFNYSDLLKMESYYKLSENLLNELKNVLILDIDNKGNNLNSKELIKLNEYNNPINWSKALKMHRNTFSINKKKYFNLLDKTGDNIHKKIESIVSEKLKLLFNNCAISTPNIELNSYATSTINIIEYCTNSKNINSGNFLAENNAIKKQQVNDYLNGKELPNYSIKLKPGEVIIDVKKFVNTNLFIINNNTGLITPYLDRLVMLMNILKEQEKVEVNTKKEDTYSHIETKKQTNNNLNQVRY